MNDEYKNSSNNPLMVLVGILIGGLAGAVTMLLLAPKSGKDTRMQINEKSIELRDRSSKYIGDTVAQVRSSVNDLTSSGRRKAKEIKNQGQNLAIEQLDHISEAVKARKKAVRNA